MNILYLCDEYPPGPHGGIGTIVRQQARALVRKGHHVVVAGYYDWWYGGENELNDNGVIVYRYRRRLAVNGVKNVNSFGINATNKILKSTGLYERDIKNGMIKYRAFLENLIIKHKIELVEMPDYNDYMRYTRKYIPFPVLPVPVIVKLHGNITYSSKENNLPLPEHIWQMEHDLLKQATAVASVSKYTAQKTAAYLEYKKPVTILYNGIDTTVANQKGQKIKGRVVFTGALSENKGIYQLVKAWNLVHAQLPQASLYILGKGPIKKIEKLLDKRSVRTVHFTGHVSHSDVNKYLSTAEVAVFPSMAESFGLGPIEAMANGTATIYTKKTVGPEIVNDGETGILVDPLDTEEIADNIILLLKDLTLQQRLAKAGQDFVITHFDINNVIEKNIAFYRSVINNTFEKIYSI
ncbi:MAG: glycosyltransferase family 4 protein [Taibaiella sp.]|nr:glycosyltransferase family 4 protein [Taibaiella sp.]